MPAAKHGRKVPKGHKRNPNWERESRAWLAKQPVQACTVCLGKTHLQVHHILPFHLFPAEEMKPSNWTILCEAPGKNCHLHFGHCFNFEAYNPDVIQDAKIWQEKIKNRKMA